jgi:ABC-type multidrug transport system fused ATPase/permease subunit
LKKLSNQTQEAVGEMTKVASESLSALRTVQAYNAHEQEQTKFHDRIDRVLSLAKKEATASAIFFGSTGWSGNVTILSLLGYGIFFFVFGEYVLIYSRWDLGVPGSNLCRRPD